MNKITLLGLGCEEGDITLKGLELLKNSKIVLARTGKSQSFKTLEKLNINVKTLDYVYEKSRNFDTLNKNLAKEVISSALKGDIVYAVDGSVIEDSSCKEILKRYKSVEVIAGVSASIKCLERLKISSTKCTALSAYDYVKGASINLPAVVYAVDSKELAGEIKLKLIDAVGEEMNLFICDNNFSGKIKVYELDRQKNYDYSTAVYIPDSHFLNKERFEFNDLLDITRALRGENGCPWDREQTPKSIEKNLIEETYELLDAIEKDDDDMIVEEIGDLLLQTAFYIIFGEEVGRYNYYDVLSGICSKLISRHTHVFGQDKAEDSSSALDTWNKNKSIEKGYESGTDYLMKVPSNLPSVMRAQKVGSRASKLGFDFNNCEEVFSKIHEEIEEIRQAIKNGEKTQVAKECGDLLFSCVNAVRKLDVDGETALKYSTEKFIKRFENLENAVKNKGKNLKDLSQKELDNIYDELKKVESSNEY